MTVFRKFLNIRKLEILKIILKQYFSLQKFYGFNELLKIITKNIGQLRSA